MCLAIPLRVIELDAPYALGEAGGLRQRFRIDCLDEVAIDDYVMVHAGFAIEVIDPLEAQKTQQLYEEIFDAVAADDD